MPARSSDLHHSAYSTGINRAHSPLLARMVPWLSIMTGSLLPHWLAIASAPLLPPLGLMTMLAWRQLRPGLLPIWAGLPLGLFDDLYSGQPFGSAVLLWSAVLIVMELIEARYPWRSFVIDWLSASGFIVVILMAGVGLANIGGGSVSATMIVPQLLASALLYPLVGRFVGLLDQWRLTRFRALF